ncbi:MAG: energy transducer TonB [Gammaproteobacteria bacterium]
MRPFTCLLGVLILSACAVNMPSPSNTHTSPIVADGTVYQAVWEYTSPSRINSIASQSVNHEGYATFTFIVRSNGSVAGIEKEQVLPKNADVSSLADYLKAGRFVPVYKHGESVESYQSYTFYYGGMTYLQYLRETCEHEGNRGNPPSGSGIDSVHTPFCTRVQYPGFLAYRFLLLPTRAACSRASRYSCEFGSVTVSFELGSDGYARDVTVLKSDAGDLIDIVAKKSVENWYFVPSAGNKLPTKSNYTIVLNYQR